MTLRCGMTRFREQTLRAVSAIQGSMTATKSLYQVNPIPRGALMGILLLSAVAIGFLFWLLYFRRVPAEFAHRFAFLPALNAVLNSLSAISLCTGLYFIKHRNPQAHRNSM